MGRSGGSDTGVDWKWWSIIARASVSLNVAEASLIYGLGHRVKHSIPPNLESPPMIR